MKLLAAILWLVILSFTSRSLVFAQVTYRQIDYPGSAGTEVTGINNFGVMVGEYQLTVGGNNHGFTLNQGQFTSFDYPSAVFTFPNDLNDSGLVVGDACISPCGFPYGFGFLYDGQTFTQISYPGQPGTEANGINNAGEIVGRVDGWFNDRAFQLTNGQFSLLTLPKPAPDDDAVGINNLGEIVGGQYKFTTGGWRAWADQNGTFKYINLPFGGVAFGVNDGGMVVGWAGQAAGGQVGFVTLKGKTIFLTYPGAFTTTALGINNAGQVVGDYTLGIGLEAHGFVTSPITAADFK